MKKLKELISLGGADDIISMTYDGKGDVLMNLGKIDRSSRPLDNNTLNPNLPSLDLPCSMTIAARNWHKRSALPARWATW